VDVIIALHLVVYDARVGTLPNCIVSQRDPNRWLDGRGEIGRLSEGKVIAQARVDAAGFDDAQRFLRFVARVDRDGTEALDDPNAL